MTAVHLPLQRPASGPASADAAPAGEPAWSRVLVVAGSRAALAVVLSLVMWAVLPAALGWSPRVIMSGSMLPRIEVGDVVVDRPVDPADLTPGRIITVTDPDHPEKTRTHRFQERDDQGRLVTKGDANDAADSTPVDPDDVLGVAVLRVPYVGLPMTWMAQGQLAPVGIAVTALLLLGLAATAPLRFAGSQDEDPDDDQDGPDGSPGDDPQARTDAGLDILVAGASAAELSDAPRARGRSLSRELPRRIVGGLGVAVGAVLAVALTTQSTYAAMSGTTSNPSSAFSSAASFTPYRDVVAGDTPLLWWRLDEKSGTAVADATANNNRGTAYGTFTWGQTGATSAEPASSALRVSTGAVTEVNATSMATNRDFSVEAWVRTTSRTGGPVLSFGNGSATTASTNVDRVLYLSPDGRARFGLGNTAKSVVSGTAALNDGDWHHLVVTATTGTNGVKLYVDGALQAQGRGSAALANGFWRAGAEDLNGWTANPTSDYFNGDLDELAVYTKVLTATEVADHYRLATA